MDRQADKQTDGQTDRQNVKVGVSVYSRRLGVSFLGCTGRRVGSWADWQEGRRAGGQESRWTGLQMGRWAGNLVLNVLYST